MKTLFLNSIRLRGFLGRDAEIHSANPAAENDYAVLTLCMDSGVWWRPANEWHSQTAWYRVVCPGPYFCGFTRGMKQGEYIEIEGILTIHHYASPNLTNPVYEIHATAISRLEPPAANVVEEYDG